MCACTYLNSEITKMLGLMEHSASKITMHVSPYTIPCEFNKYRVLLAVVPTGTGDVNRMSARFYASASTLLVCFLAAFPV
jgi:hypothetical protein